MTTKEHDKIYWAPLTKKGVIQIHEKGSYAHPALYLRKKDAEWHGGTKAVRKVRIVEVERMAMKEHVNQTGEAR